MSHRAARHPLDLGADGGLALGGHQVVAGFDGAGVFHHRDPGVVLAVRQDPALPLAHRFSAELAGGEGVTPVAERALGELHDVALVDQGDAPAALIERVADRRADQPFGALAADRLDADPGGLREADLPHPHLVLEEGDQSARFIGSLAVFHPGVDVLAVFPEDDHVHLLGVVDGTRDAPIPLHRPEAHIEVEKLAEGDIQRADAAAHRSGERPLDPHQILPEGVHRGVGEPVAGLVERLLAGEHFPPPDPPRPPVGALHGGVEHADARPPDVAPGAVPLNEGNYGVVGHLQAPVADGNAAALGRRGIGVGVHELSFREGASRGRAIRPRTTDRPRAEPPQRKHGGAIRNRSRCDRAPPNAPEL